MSAIFITVSTNKTRTTSKRSKESENEKEDDVGRDETVTTVANEPEQDFKY